MVVTGDVCIDAGMYEAVTMMIPAIILLILSTLTIQNEREGESEA